MTDYITIATAGHVDHGKTSLIKSLTGIETDTLEQEKKRGLTIDLGFAYFVINEHSLNPKIINFIDVPGHKDFIKNMLAGISGVNTVLLVISANEGIMPQTKEHIDIIKLLDIKNLIVIISKTDLVDENHKKKLKENVKEYLNNCNLKPLKILDFSILENTLTDNIINILADLEFNNNNKKIKDNFILPVDRVFSKKGFGTIVTGTVYSGTLSLNDSLYLKNEKIKVKNIQFNNKNCDSVSINQRVSLNINTNNEVKRGDLLSINNLDFYNSMNVSLNTINEVKNNSKIKFYYLSKEVGGRINLFNKKIEKDNSQTFAKITLDEYVQIEQNMKYIIRLQSPDILIGGGKVLSFNNPDKKINIEKKIKLLNYIKNEDLENAFNYLISDIYNIFNSKDLKYYFKQEEILNLLKLNLSDLKIIELEKDTYIKKDKFQENKNKVIDLLLDFKINNPEVLGLTKFDISNKLNIKLNLLDKILAESIDKIDIYKNLYFIKRQNINISNAEKEILNILDNDKFQTFKDLSLKLNKKETEIKSIIDSLIFKKIIIMISPDMMCTLETLNKILDLIKSFIGKEKKTTSQIREYLNLSRKYTIPILEYLDKNHITKRDGDYRVLK